MNSYPAKVILTTLLVLGGVFVYSRFGPALPISSTVTQKQNLFSVSGMGKVTVVPDTAEISAGISVNRPTVKAAQTEANTIINNVTSALKKLGIPEKDIQTSNYSIYPQYDYQSGVNRVTGYNVTTNVSVTVRDLEKINSTIDAATSNGATQVGGINLTVNDDRRKKLLEEAREKAITEAKAKAESLAKLSGMTLGKIVDVQEAGSFVQPPIYSLMKTDSALVGRGGGTEIEPGSTDISTTITLFFETR